MKNFITMLAEDYNEYAWMSVFYDHVSGRSKETNLYNDGRYGLTLWLLTQIVKRINGADLTWEDYGKCEIGDNEGSKIKTVVSKVNVRFGNEEWSEEKTRDIIEMLVEDYNKYAAMSSKHGVKETPPEYEDEPWVDRDDYAIWDRGFIYQMKLCLEKLADLTEGTHLTWEDKDTWVSVHDDKETLEYKKVSVRFDGKKGE